jgi:hypothetical protein
MCFLQQVMHISCIMIMPQPSDVCQPCNRDNVTAGSHN